MFIDHRLDPLLVGEGDYRLSYANHLIFLLIHHISNHQTIKLRLKVTINKENNTETPDPPYRSETNDLPGFVRLQYIHAHSVCVQNIKDFHFGMRKRWETIKNALNTAYI